MHILCIQTETRRSVMTGSRRQIIVHATYADFASTRSARCRDNLLGFNGVALLRVFGRLRLEGQHALAHQCVCCGRVGLATLTSAQDSVAQTVVCEPNQCLKLLPDQIQSGVFIDLPGWQSDLTSLST